LGVDVDLSLVRIPDDWLVFPSPDGEHNAPRHPLDQGAEHWVKLGAKVARTFDPDYRHVT
jgi:hypothetical protein